MVGRLGVGVCDDGAEKGGRGGAGRSAFIERFGRLEGEQHGQVVVVGQVDVLGDVL